MNYSYSPRVRNLMLELLASEFINGKVLRIYAGATPADATAALGGATLLVEISNDATGVGLTMNATVTSDGLIEKNSSEVWRGVAVATGTASFFRLVDPADTGTASTTAERLQGDTAMLGAILNLSSLAFTAGASTTIQTAVFAN